MAMHNLGSYGFVVFSSFADDRILKNEFVSLCSIFYRVLNDDSPLLTPH